MKNNKQKELIELLIKKLDNRKKYYPDIYECIRCGHHVIDPKYTGSTYRYVCDKCI